MEAIIGILTTKEMPLSVARGVIWFAPAPGSGANGQRALLYHTDSPERSSDATSRGAGVLYNLVHGDVENLTVLTKGSVFAGGDARSLNTEFLVLAMEAREARKARRDRARLRGDPDGDGDGDDDDDDGHAFIDVEGIAGYVVSSVVSLA
jgi:hypothetical protein